MDYKRFLVVKIVLMLILIIIIYAISRNGNDTVEDKYEDFIVEETSAEEIEETEEVVATTVAVDMTQSSDGMNMLQVDEPWAIVVGTDEFGNKIYDHSKVVYSFTGDISAINNTLDAWDEEHTGEERVDEVSNTVEFADIAEDLIDLDDGIHYDDEYFPYTLYINPIEVVTPCPFQARSEDISWVIESTMRNNGDWSKFAYAARRDKTEDHCYLLVVSGSGQFYEYYADVNGSTCEVYNK